MAGRTIGYTVTRLSGFAVLAERLGNCLKGNGSDIAYVVPNSGLQLRQDEVEFSLALGGDGLSA